MITSPILIAVFQKAKNDSSMDTRMKILNKILFAFVTISLAVMAFIILLLNYQLLMQYSFTPTVTGVRFYFSFFSDYKDLFVVAIAATAAYIGLQSLQQTVQANKERLKQDRFSEWKSRVDSRIMEVEKNDPYLRRVFLERRMKYFNALFDRDFFISNKDELALCLAVFSDLVPFLEDQNNRTVKLGQVYVSDDQAYSYDAFRFVFIGGADGAYPEIETDLKAYYLGLLPNRPVVDQETYKQAVINSIPNVA
jgi:hypothetical protein